jgi:tetrahydromethanopterin S-methyltransferase subunit D
MEPITLLILLICITLGGLLVGVGVHFVPVGGAPAAMAQATGIGTGTTMLAFSSGALGLISAGFTTREIMDPAGQLHSAYPGFGTAIANGTLFSVAGISDNIMAIILVMVAGIIGAMLMMVILAVMANVLYAFAIAVPLVSAKVKFDPITGDRQDIYVTKGTEGHGTPTVAVISSLIGGLFGGLGGAILYLALVAGGFSIATAAFAAIGVFLVNSVLASYNITGTIEGFHDPKFKRIPRAIIACAVASLVLGIWAVALIYLIGA